MAKEYDFGNLKEDVDGIYVEPLNGRLGRLIGLVGQVESARGVDLSFSDAGEAINYLVNYIGEKYREHREPVRIILSNALEGKALLPLIFDGKPIMVLEREEETSEVEPIPRRKTRKASPRGEEVPVSLYQEFFSEYKRRGLKGKKLETTARSSVSNYRKDPRIAKHIRTHGRRSKTKNIKAARKGVKQIAKEVMDRKNK